MIELEQREQVVKEALTWLGTPYQHMGRVKGAGTDCGMLLLEVYEKVGLIPHVELDYYPIDWHLHHSEEVYLGWIKRFCTLVDREPKPGDILLYQWGRCVAHGAIVTNYPEIIHAYVGKGVILADTEQIWLKNRLKHIYSFWE